MRQNRISINDIKWDLIKIIEPYDGRLENKVGSDEAVSSSFTSYLGDLSKQGKIQDFNIVSSLRETAITYDIAIKLSVDRSPKKLKIHVGIFQYPWVKKEAA
tara:strand:- start:349 stop:654 length:306 start_codon:yes stop_codon:yes gene_type:complete